MKDYGRHVWNNGLNLLQNKRRNILQTIKATI
jgi:hypothetical protein